MEDNIETENLRMTDSAVPTAKLLNSLQRRILSPMVCSILAAVGIFGGISALFIGLVCIVIHAAIPGDRSFDQVGTILLITAIPAILIGSIFLDEIREIK